MAMARDFKNEAFAENEQRKASRDWIESRINTIRQNVTAYDILRRNGVQIYRTDREEQFSCPFHGTDHKPSARVYPSSVRGPSHVWCFVCQERWDVISLWKKFSGVTDMKFTQTLAEIERAFGIIPADRPSVEYDPQDDPEVTKAEIMFDIAERNLVGARRAFQMTGYLTVGVLLDRLRHQFVEGAISPGKVCEQLQKVLDKISEKEKACLAG